jgi:hypothetical protein
MDLTLEFNKQITWSSSGLIEGNEEPIVTREDTIKLLVQMLQSKGITFIKVPGLQAKQLYYSC